MLFRSEADRIDIDRTKRVLEAHGSVVSQFVDRTPPPAKQAAAKGKTAPAKSTPAKTTAPVFTLVRASDLVYTEESREAHYWGGVALRRPGLTTDAKEIHAFLNDSSSDSSLNRMIADGSVKMVETSTDPKVKRTKTGLSEHAEYYAAEQKLVMERGDPRLIDSEIGTTTGCKLTWFAGNDRLLNEACGGKQGESTVRKK